MDSYYKRLKEQLYDKQSLEREEQKNGTIFSYGPSYILKCFTD
jgi:hypothetical protein